MVSDVVRTHLLHCLNVESAVDIYSILVGRVEEEILYQLFGPTHAALLVPIRLKF
jgi:hypothetical protein